MGANSKKPSWVSKGSSNPNPNPKSVTVTANVMPQKWDWTDLRVIVFNRKTEQVCARRGPQRHTLGSRLCVCSVQSWSMLQDEGSRAVTQSYLQVVISPSSLVAGLRVTNGVIIAEALGISPERQNEPFIFGWPHLSWQILDSAARASVSGTANKQMPFKASMYLLPFVSRYLCFYHHSDKSLAVMATTTGI